MGGLKKTQSIKKPRKLPTFPHENTDILPKTTEFKTQFSKEEYFDMKYSSSYIKSHPKIISDGSISHSYCTLKVLLLIQSVPFSHFLI